MIDSDETDGQIAPRVPSLLAVLLLLFAASGCSALIYEIVWFQLLQLVIGSSAVSLGVLLATFMGGMCLGSIVLPRLVRRQIHPFYVYCLLELGIGIAGIALLFGLPSLDAIYSGAMGHGVPALFLRGTVCAVCLLPPTILMGATLPAIARWVRTTPDGIAWLGFFYGGNIAGAVIGCLLAGFYLLRVHDMPIATYAAAALNGGVALLSFVLARWTSKARISEISQPESQLPKPRGRNPWASAPIYVAIGLSGASALAAEVIWTRLLSLSLGATVYTFSIILAVFLAGLGAGSAVGSLLARTSERPRLVFGGCQFLLAAAVAWAAYMLSQSIPYWPINPYSSRSPWLLFQVDLVRALWAVFPATCLWGASFPLALAAAGSGGQDSGRLVGGLYAANTVGAIVGALAASLFLVPVLGTQNAQRLVIVLSALAAAVLVVPAYARWRVISRSSGPVATRALRLAAAALAIAFFFTPATLLAWAVAPVPWELVAFGRAILSYDGSWQNRYVGEGLNSSIAVTETSAGVRNFHVSGKVEASSEFQDMRLQRMLAHVPALLHSKPRSVLIVGFGAGVTAGSFIVHPDIERIVICEIEPLIPQQIGPYFSKENYDVVHDPRVQIVYDDARHFILTTPEKFDIITSDPIHPWVKGSATLYTKEYFELCKRHLNPGGRITQWVPLYETDTDVVKSEIATFFAVFPNGTIWSNDQNGDGYDLVLLGQTEPLAIDADELQKRLDRADHKRVAKSLEEVGFQTVVGLLATYGGQAGHLAPWLAYAEINRDRNLRLQYLAGMQLNTNQSKLIYEEMKAFRRFPENLLVGSGWRSLAVRLAIEKPAAERVE
jgi:spermidine synthase